MTMFKKVFGNQMAASEDTANTPDAPKTPHAIETETADLPAPTPPRSQPLFAPVPQVLSVKEQENADRRAACEAERQERLHREHVGSPPFVRPSAQAAPAPTSAPTVADPQPQPQPPATPAPPRPAGRARTRLLGFGGGDDAAIDPMAGPVATTSAQLFPTGWIVVTDGPGRGHFFPLFNGVSMVGRDEAQTIALSFGDMTISRENHAAIAYDEENNQFYVGHGGKSNIIRLNGKPVLSTEALSHGDTLRIGETVLRFVALCGADFDWMAQTND